MTVSNLNPQTKMFNQVMPLLVDVACYQQHHATADY